MRQTKRIVDLKLRVKELPAEPGVYLMKSNQDKIIYVGKAKDLRSRVRSYFQDKKHISAKTQYLVGQIHQIDYLITKTEVEAFLLEASLIKKHRPKYNIRLKDDKAYPYIRLSAADEFPRFYLYRKVKPDGAYYFGPYTSGLHVRETIKFLNRTFQIRDCTDGFMKSRKRPCLTYQIGRCTAPCVDLVTKKSYGADVEQALDFLKGRDKKVLKELNAKMKEASKAERFEAAAKLRDSIKSIDAILEKQIVVSQKMELDQDVIAYFGDERGTLVETLHIRAGRVIGSRAQFLPRINCNSADEDPKEWLTSFLNQYYSENVVPDQIILPVDLTDDIYKLMRDVFKERKQTRAHFIHALDREQKKLMAMAEKNAKSHFADHVNRQTNTSRLLEEIQSKLHLRETPIRMECFDISNFQGDESVASQVVFEDGAPKREDYRRYKIKTVVGANDFASMKEVLTRRFKHTEYDDPQLVVIDGGKGQLGMALQALKELGREDIQCVGMAKAKSEGTFQDKEVSYSEERFFLPGRSNPVLFHASSEAIKILIQLRDEAHRFAITYHRKLRDEKMFQSELDGISGLGEKRKIALLKHFGSVELIAGANIDEIASVSGMNKKLAELVKAELERGELEKNGVVSDSLE
ncbi:MAG: excinuclease ABC subunit UvrC [Bdellovibrionales bacterium]|nr:excinuclease ABC subunit UvrC [Bdellovibrionales bacterium]